LVASVTADLCETDSMSALQAPSPVGVKKHDQEVCKSVEVGHEAPIDGIFTAQGSKVAYKAARGDITESAGRFCVDESTVTLLQRAFSVSHVSDFDVLLRKKKQTEAPVTEAPVTGAPVTEAPVTEAPVATKFSCDAACIRREIQLHGADIIISADNVKYSMEVLFEGGPASGDACGKENLQFPAYSVAANPSIGTKMTTAETRSEPSITFECTPGKAYHLLMADALGGAFQKERSYNHWLKLNLNCPMGGEATVAGNGRDIAQGQPTIKGYLPPGFPYHHFGHFGFYIFETSVPFSDDSLDEFDQSFPQANQLQAKDNPAYTVTQVADLLGFDSPPVAWTWADVTTSYYSPVSVAGVAADSPFRDTLFYQLQCPCQLASSFPGLENNGDERCNLRNP